MTEAGVTAGGGVAFTAGVTAGVVVAFTAGVAAGITATVGAEVVILVVGVAIGVAWAIG